MTWLVSGKHMLIVALCASCCAMTGCVESQFNLAGESRLPRWMTVPPDLTRADVSTEMRYYLKPGKRTATFILRDKKGQKLAKVNGTLKGLYPLFPNDPAQKLDHRFQYPSYEVITANGITEIIEHKKPEPIYYVNDDPAVREALLDGGAGSKE